MTKRERKLQNKQAKIEREAQLEREQQRQKRMFQWQMASIALLLVAAAVGYAVELRMRALQEIESARQAIGLEQYRKDKAAYERRARERDAQEMQASMRYASAYNQRALHQVSNPPTHHTSTDTTQDSGTTPNKVLFNGQHQDETGLYYLRNRYYNPSNGRFLTHDPMLGSSEDPPSLHRYTYAHNDPVNNVDPSGLFTLTQVSVGTSIAESIRTSKSNFDMQLLGRVDRTLGGLSSAVEHDLELALMSEADEFLHTLSHPMEYIANQDVPHHMYPLGTNNDGTKMLASFRGQGHLARALMPRTRFWRRITRFDGVKVFQRNELINPDYIGRDPRWNPRGLTNLERMQEGLAPYGSDNLRINLHHMLQTHRGPMIEVTQTFHTRYRPIVHINWPARRFPSGIDRDDYDKWRAAYWKRRAQDFEE